MCCEREATGMCAQVHNGMNEGMCVCGVGGKGESATG